MSIRRSVSAMAAGLMIFTGCAAVTAVPSPAAVAAVASAHGTADQRAGSFRPLSVTPDTAAPLCNYYNDGCITSDGVSGKQVWVTSTGYHSFEVVDDPEWLGLKDTSTGLCLKDDPNENSIVVELACTTSGTTGQEENWTEQEGEGIIYWFNDYPLFNPESSIYLHMSTITNDVNCYKSGETGNDWYWG